MIKHPELLQNGFIQISYPLPSQIKTWVQLEDWKSIDHYFLSSEKKGGELWSFFQSILDFEMCEHIIAVRKAPDDEEGIWHDDGSRSLGFSLSLNLDPATIHGGELRFRAKGVEEYMVFKPLPFGEMVIFLSGIYGYEHQVSQVKTGQRVVVAGWCSS